MKTFLKVAVLAAAAMSLSACAAGFPLTGNPAADAKTAAANINAATNPQQFIANVKAFNDVVGQACGGYANLDWTPPLPPTGSIHAQCAIGKQPTTPAPAQMPFGLGAPTAAPAPTPASPLTPG